MANDDKIAQRFASVFDKLFDAFSKTVIFSENKKKAVIHDMPHTIHFAILVKGTQPIGYPMTNAINVHASFAGPQWTRCLNSDENASSIHAEARVLQRMLSKKKSQQTKKARKNCERSTFGTAANGIVITRFGRAGDFRLSKPCVDCVQRMHEHGIQFVVYSTADGQWKKESIRKLYEDDENPYVCATQLRCMEK